MIGGDYAVRLSSTYIRSDQQNCGFTFGIPCGPNSTYSEACIQISGSGSTVTGTIKLKKGDGTWEQKDSRTLSLLSGNSGRGINQGTPGTPEKCDFYFVQGQGHVNRLTNWCGRNRQFDQHGWRGALTRSQTLRVAVDNHVLNMTGDGRRTMTHGQTCP